jgi:hypothetical protein
MYLKKNYFIERSNNITTYSRLRSQDNVAIVAHNNFDILLENIGTI